MVAAFDDEELSMGSKAWAYPMGKGLPTRRKRISGRLDGGDDEVRKPCRHTVKVPSIDRDAQESNRQVTDSTTEK